MKRAPLLISFILFLALCASAAYWVLQFIQPKARPMVAPPESVTLSPPLSSAAALLGGKANNSLSSAYQLSGIIMANQVADRVAILASQGQAAHAYRLHAQLSAGVELAEINNDYVLLSVQGALKRIDLVAGSKLAVNNTMTAPTSTPAQSQFVPLSLPSTVPNQNVGTISHSPILATPQQASR
jgi:general secretion pathway protein C